MTDKLLESKDRIAESKTSIDRLESQKLERKMEDRDVRKKIKNDWRASTGGPTSRSSREGDRKYQECK